MNFQIKLYKEGAQVPFRTGVWSASNVHTAVSRALTAFPMEIGRGVAHTGNPSHWVKLDVGQAVIVKVRRL